jgi:hypothetical protein
MKLGFARTCPCGLPIEECPWYDRLLTVRKTASYALAGGGAVLFWVGCLFGGTKFTPVPEFVAATVFFWIAWLLKK